MNRKLIVIMAAAVSTALATPIAAVADELDPGNGPAATAPRITVTATADGLYRTTIADADGSTFNVTAQEPMTGNVVVTRRFDEAGNPSGVQVEGFIVPATDNDFSAQAASGDLGCGGSAPLSSIPFSGKVTNGGTYQGALVICRDSMTGKKVYVLDKMWMSAKGQLVSGIFSSIPDTFWVQSYAHSRISPKVLEMDSISSISDTAGACTSYSLGLSGAATSAGMSGAVCRGTMSPLLVHNVNVGGMDSKSYGVKYEGTNVLMTTGTTYGIKNLGFREAERYLSGNAYRKVRRQSGVRWHIDFDIS